MASPESLSEKIKKDPHSGPYKVGQGGYCGLRSWRSSAARLVELAKPEGHGRDSREGDSWMLSGLVTVSGGSPFHLLSQLFCVLLWRLSCRLGFPQLSLGTARALPPESTRRHANRQNRQKRRLHSPGPSTVPTSKQRETRDPPEMAPPRRERAAQPHASQRPLSDHCGAVAVLPP